jgi:hypothetical protein
MALTADTPAKIMEGDFADYPIAASMKIYEGALVAIDKTSGLAKNLIADTGDFLAGVAQKLCDNSAGAGAALKVHVRRGRGSKLTIQCAVTGATQAGVGLAVYASDENTFTMTASTNKAVGKLAYFETAAICHVRLDIEI